jgi:polysaccharide deacetylase family protein (PEP-CTERM system associated)
MTAPVALSFDVEEHHRIEAAAGFDCPADRKADYASRMESATRWLLDLLAEKGQHATFFVVGQIAKSHPRLIRAMAEAGHEVASHSWDHRRVHHFKPDTFRDDVRQSQDALEQAAGVPVMGFRAPTFSVMRDTGWAIDVLAELGMRYDSSIYPVRHDRYGVPDAPRTPFMARGHQHEILELPPLTLRLPGLNLPVGGGGYFRLFPTWVLEWGLRQSARLAAPLGMLYFHPWEFDPDQPRLPLGRLSRWRTYVGTGTSRRRLARLMDRHHFLRVIDAVSALEPQRPNLPRFTVVRNGDPET